MITAILNIARLNLQLALQDRGTYIQAFLVPIILITVFGVALSEEQFVDIDLLIDVVDNDNSALSQEFINTLATSSQDSETIIICQYRAENNPDECNLENSDNFEDKGQERLEDGQVAATIVIPDGFADALTKGKSVTLDYWSNDQLNAPHHR